MKKRKIASASFHKPGEMKVRLHNVDQIFFMQGVFLPNKELSGKRASLKAFDLSAQIAS